MMTKKKKMTRLLAVTIFLTLIGCSEELYDIKEQHNSRDKNKISLSQFKNETNLDDIQLILKIATKTNIASKDKVQLTDFIIDTLAIKKHISQNDKTTYSFRIYPLSSISEQNGIYNLVYRKANDVWEKSIFYLNKNAFIDKGQKIFKKIERIYDSKASNSISSKKSSLEMCSYETTSYHCTNTGPCDENIGKCDDCYLCKRTTVTYEPCVGGGGGGGGSSDPGDTSGSGGGSTDPYAYAPNFYDNPVYDDPNYINAVKRSYAWANLGESGQYFFASNDENMYAFNLFIQYQIDNKWSPESEILGNELLNLHLNIINLNNDIKSDDFDPLNLPWLQKAREYAAKIEKLKDKVPFYIREILDIAIDNSFILALNKTALKINPEAFVDSEPYKTSQFQYNGKNGVGILLYEFANGLGKDKRDFYFTDDVTQQMLAGNVITDIKNDFLDKLVKNGLTYSQFVSQGNMIRGGYSFSPDHTTVTDSFIKHVNANWVQFFIGGTSAEYRPTGETGWIEVILSNETSRKSLLLHKGDNYGRDGLGNNKSLSTIKQYFRFKLKVN